MRKRNEESLAAETTGESGITDRQFVVALARGLEVLRAFRPGDGTLGNQEIAERTGLPKPTVSRLTYTLTRLGHLVYLGRIGKYQLGAPVLSLGYALLANTDVRRVARPLMQELADYANASISLGTRDRLDMVYVEHCRGSAMVTLRLDIGSHIPLATTAMGRAFLAALPDSERIYLMEAIRARVGSDWPRLRDGIEASLEEVRQRGFCLSVGDWQSDVHGVAVPFVTVDGSTVMAFNCGGPSFLLDHGRMESDLGPRLVELVHNVTALMARA
jgi:DNA-binding IclR family transcriptional regulator